LRDQDIGYLTLVHDLQLGTVMSVVAFDAGTVDAVADRGSAEQLRPIPYLPFTVICLLATALIVAFTLASAA